MPPCFHVSSLELTQVWQSFPALKGRRIVCPHSEYARRPGCRSPLDWSCVASVSAGTRGRWGAQAAAAFFVLAALAFLAIFLHSLVTKGATGQLHHFMFFRKHFDLIEALAM